MVWTVLFHSAFDAEFSALAEGLQDELLAHANLLAMFGPQLGRPTVDTLKGFEDGKKTDRCDGGIACST